MKTIAQRTLRNESGRILRGTENGEEFIVTVQGRPVALIGPYDRRRWIPADRVSEMLETPTDPSVLEELRDLEPDLLTDPWER